MFDGSVIMYHSKGKEDCEFPIKFDTYQHMYNGSHWKTKDGYFVEVIDYIDSKHVKVKFLNTEFPYMGIFRMDHIKEGIINYPYHRTVFGGYFGEGKFKNCDKCYDVWSNMLKRTYHIINNSNSEINYKNLSYTEVKVDQSWYNFQTFAEWYYEYLGRLNTSIGINYELDKDILQWNFDKKIYGPNTCCLVPHEINASLINSSNTDILPIGVCEVINRRNKYKAMGCAGGKQEVLGFFETPEEAFICYKGWKEQTIKNLADKYYSIGALTPEIRNALYSLEIAPYCKGRRNNNG